MSYYLVLVGTLDNPLYEAFLPSTKSAPLSSSPASVTSASFQQSQAAHGQGSSFSIFGGLPTPSPSQPGSGPDAASATVNGGTTSAVGYGGAKLGAAGKHVMQLVAHAALDVVEDVQWGNGAMYLKAIDKFHEWTVSAWLTPGGVKIIILHDLKNDDGIKNFLQETWESYVKTLLNPFHELNAPILSPTFDARIKASARKHL